MKTDNSIKNITIAAINRKVMNPEEWIYSRICVEDKSVEFIFEENELSIFEISSFEIKTIVTTCRIIEKNESNVKSLKFENIRKVSYGNFKGTNINKIELSTFRIIDVFGEVHDFQIETGKASIGLINAVSTVLKLKSQK